MFSKEDSGILRDFDVLRQKQRKRKSCQLLGIKPEAHSLSCQRSTTEWLQGVQLRHSVPPVQYIEKIVRAGGCPVVITQ